MDALDCGHMMHAALCLATVILIVGKLKPGEI
jgi:hypothetical protein